MRILISAGEASGELYGAQLIEALRRVADPAGQLGRPGAAVPTRSSQLKFFGAGGERMRAAGCDTVVDSKDLAVVGIAEVVSHLPRIYGCYRRLIAEADKRKPDLAIIIDSPSFNLRVARRMHKRGVPVVYYVCPQFWAWRQGRVRLLREYIQKALVIFPFEEKFYRDRGVDATFVGHPLASLARPTISREEYAAAQGLDPHKPWITIMPGSRVTEVEKNLAGILGAVAQVGPAYEYLLPVAPTLGRSYLQDAMPTGSAVHLVPEARPALVHSRAGIIASGTATVEAAMMGTPFVMVYRVTPLTYWIGKPTVKVPHFAMVNLIAGREVVPELVQHDFTAEKVVANVKQILSDGPARETMLQGLAYVRQSLRGADTDHLQAADRAAGIILQLINTKALQ